MENKIYLLIILTLAFQVEAKRHAKAKKSEAVSQQKIARVTGDQELRKALGKQSKDMTFKEAHLAKDYYAKEKDDEMFIKCGQRLLAVSGDQDVMRNTRLELAEIFLKQNNYAQAEKYAQEYQKHYPGSAQAKRACFIEIQANYKAKLASDRDQEKTHKTIKLAKSFADKYPDDTEYKQEIDAMLNQCYKTIIRSEINIIQTQLNTYNNTKKDIVLSSAKKRLLHIKENYLPHVPEAAKRLHELEKEINELLPVQKDDIKQPELILAYNTPKQDNKKSFIDKMKAYVIEDNDAYFA